MQTDDLSRFLHTHSWEDFLGSTGAEVMRDNDSLFVKGNLPSGGTYWRSSRLFVDDAWAPPSFTSGAWFLRLEPVNDALTILEKYGKVTKTDSVQPKQTMVMNLSLSEEELLAGMKSKHRYNIRVAEKHGVTTEFFHENAAEHFDRFWNLLSETAERHTFKTHAKDYYKSMIASLAPQGKAHLGIAQLEDKDIATILLVTEGTTTTYLHGGSSRSHKEVMAPFLLHWKAMQWAKSQGFMLYDFWGTNAIETEDGWEARKNHPSSGTTRFKLGFGGEVKSYPGAFDLVLKPIPYTLYSAIRRIIRRQSNF